jgi:hypothetical protein
LDTDLASPTPQADTLLALAVDLLAQAEAHHRAANRLEVATRNLARGAQTRGSFDMDQVRQVRAHVIALEDLSTANRNLLIEFSREIDALVGRARGA